MLCLRAFRIVSWLKLTTIDTHTDWKCTPKGTRNQLIALRCTIKKPRTIGPVRVLQADIRGDPPGIYYRCLRTLCAAWPCSGSSSSVTSFTIPPLHDAHAIGYARITSYGSHVYRDAQIFSTWPNVEPSIRGCLAVLADAIFGGLGAPLCAPAFRPVDLPRHTSKILFGQYRSFRGTSRLHIR